MKMNIPAFFIATVLTLTLSGNASATFGELSFVWVIDQTSGGTTEVLSNLGAIGAAIDLSAQNVVLSSSNVLDKFNGAALSSLTVSYTGYQVNADSGYSFDIWVGGSNTTAPKTAGSMDAQYQSNFDQVIQYANRLGGTTSDEVVGDTSNRASYYKKMNPTGQYGSNGAFTSLDSNSNASLADLVTKGYVDQTIYFFSGQVNSDYVTDPSTGLKVAVIRTSYNAATGQLTSTLNPTPIPAAFLLMGSGLLGLVGIRRKI
jgi:hypothetical protein